MTPALAASLHRDASLADAALRYAVDVWRSEDGLPQNSVHAIRQTRDGYLWLGTQEGLVRFDGIRFVVYEAPDTPGLAGNDVRVLYEDREGNLWIGTEGGVSRLEKGTLTTFAKEQGLAHPVVSAIAEDAEGSVWVGTYEGGLSRFRDGALTRFTTRDGLSSDLIRALHVDRAGNLWIGTDGGGVNRFRDGRFQVYTSRDGLPHDTVYTILEDSRGRLWVGTAEGGLGRLEPGGFANLSSGLGLADQNVYAIYEDRERRLWLGTGGGGLYRIKEQGSSVSLLPVQGLSNGIVYAIHGDAEGSLWVGTGGGGLNRVRQAPFATVTMREGLSNDMVSTITEGADGTLWIGTWGGGLNRCRGASCRALTTRDGLSSNIVSSVYEDRKGRLWIGTYGAGLDRLEKGRVTVYTTSNGLASDTVWGIAEGGDGSLWIGTSGGLSRLRDGKFETFTTRDGLSSDVVRAVHVDREGVLWLGTNGGGLNRFEGGRFFALTARQGLSSDVVYSIFEDGEGVLWVGSSDGLTRIEGNAVRAFRRRDGLCENRIFRVLEDRTGNLWMSSNKGIFRIEKRQLNARARGEPGEITCTLYGKSAGMRSVECSGGSQPAGWTGRDGKLWFPTILGAVIVDPMQVKRNPIPPPVVIEEVIMDRIVLDRGRSTEIPPGRHELAFRYAAPSFVDPERVRFQYRLDDFNEEWVEADTRRIATYTNIPPGAYEFRVRACNNDGLWNETGASFGFRIRPHVYQTRTFLVGTALAVALSGFGLHRVRIRRLKLRESQLAALVEARTGDLLEANRQLAAANRQQADFVSGVSHELKTPLTLIRLYGETLLLGPGALEEDQKSYYSIIVRESERLTRLVDRVLDYSRIERGERQYALRPGDLTPTVARTVRAYETYLGRQGFSVRLELPETLPSLPFDPEAVAEAIVNLIDNAAKYSGDSKEIGVRLFERSGAVVIEVRDGGIGIPEGERENVFHQFYRIENGTGKGGYGLGLYLVRHIMRAHGGDVELESEVGRGSRFSLVFNLPPATGSSATGSRPSEWTKPGKRS